MTDKKESRTLDKLTRRDRLDFAALDCIRDVLTSIDVRAFSRIGNFITFAAEAMPALLHECQQLMTENECLKLKLRQPMPARQKIVFEIPPGTPPAKCRGCAQTVFWVMTEAGKKMPVDADGQSHFATCPQAQKFRREPKKP